MKTLRGILYLSFLGLLLFGSVATFAQVTEGSITGSVTDQSGAAVVKAQVVTRNTATGVERAGVTDASGLYWFQYLQPGTYSVTVNQAGFGESKLNGIIVEPSAIARADIKLAVGSVAANVEVTDTVSPIDVEEGRLTNTLTEQQVQDLPTAGRDVYTLALLQPGIVATLAPVISDTQANTFMDGFSANGATARGNNYVVDGVSNNNEWLGGTPEISPSVEALQSFQVQTANFSAEYGRNNGAIVIATTRAGSNAFHGSVYDYIRNPIFDAGNEFDQPLTGKSNIHRNDFGVSFGGPIRKDKTFFFFNYEGLQESDSSTLLSIGETPQYRAEVAQYRPDSIANQQFQLFPSGPCVPGTVTNTGSIYGETVPQSVIAASPVLQQFVDGPPEASGGDTCETSYLYRTPVLANQYTARIDHHFSDKDSMFARFIEDTHSTDTASQELNGAAARGFRAPLYGNFPSFLLSEIHIFNSHVLNDFRVEYARSDFGIGFDAPGAGTATSNYPWLYFDSGFTAFGGADFVPRNFVFNNFTYEDSVALQVRKHAIKTGVELQRLEENSNYHSQDNGFYEFQDQFTFGNDGAYYQTAAVNPVTGQFASTPRHFRQTWFAAFAEDDWQATRRLAVNLGVRYDLYGVPTETNGILSNITLGTGTTFGQQVANAIVGRVPRLFDGDHNNVSPRIGFAYDVTGKGTTAIRGSIAQAYLAPFSNLYTNTSRFDSPDVAFPFVFPYYYGGTITYGVPALLNPAYETGLTPQGGIAGTRINPSGVQTTLRDSYSNQYFLGIQQKLGAGFFATANYVGTAGRKLYIRDDINRFTGDRPSNGVGAVRYNQQWGSTTYVDNGNTSNYNGMNLQLQHPMAKGYSLTVNYTYGKALDIVSDPGLGDYSNVSVALYNGTMDEQKPRLDYGPSDFDARQRLTADGSWMVPSPKGHTLAAGVLGGWQLNGVMSLQSGRPFSVICTNTTYCDFNGDGDGYDRPNAPIYGNTKRGLHRSDYIKGDFIHAADFTDPNTGASVPSEALSISGIPEGKDGNLGRNTFRGPGYADVDASLFKSFELTSRYKLQLRAESFNLFNRVNLYLPNSNLSGSFFGQSTTAFPARNMQFAAKLLF